MKVFAVVVLYNPKKNILKNINSYIEYVERLYMIDNSDKKNMLLVNEMKKLSGKCIYIDNKGNQGIAKALNKAATLAIKNGAEWLLSMDQDSCFEEGSLDKMFSWIKINDTKRLGILSPYQLAKDKIDEFIKEDKVIDRLTVSTSGNLLNLRVFKKIGSFEEKYFIDSVDHEYCLRLKKNGFHIKALKSAILMHQLGDRSQYSLMGVKTRSTNHNYIRRYYITRNRLDVIRKYWTIFPVFCLKDIKAFITDWIKIVLFEKDKYEKNKSIRHGIRDFFAGRFGEYTR